MSFYFDQLIYQIGFWFTWLLIPIIVEILPATTYFFKLIKIAHLTDELKQPLKLPMISIILPVYNSADTLYTCIESIYKSTYSKELIQIIVVNNHSTDNSFQEYKRAQEQFNELRIQWMDTDQGKAQALNAAIYSSIGQYVVNLDTDGILHTEALNNLMMYFENNPNIDAATGTILTQKKLIDATKKNSLRILQSNEYFEYAQSFLAGRSMESQNNQLFTMSGAFSAFRRNALINTFLYNVNTVGEDTDMTFQLRDRLGKKVGFCFNAIFYVEPISGLSELYLQRQRWQRGEIEVVQKFMKNKLNVRHFFKEFMISRLMIDHTFMFPKLIWVVGLFVLLFFGYSPIVIGLSIIFMYLLYVVYATMNFVNAGLLLQKFVLEKNYLNHKWWVVFTMPLYNMLCSLIRFIGIINTITQKASWQTLNFKDEIKEIKQVITNDYHKFKEDKDNG
ncbi:TIGR03111 family XrtG-associated glycosyltransferase [Leuconostoc miyukkimchii]|uniref:TIGR03111 family XrtG-associated glycosyltransferase n=1 Tax=Leuconostoc miyukkimchii TaxID=910540 RepID=UPI001C7D0107|nr:TIGR03111 family XrtG-associated glycosyltransferase [Leuconostoc miyukkimchii]